MLAPHSTAPAATDDGPPLPLNDPAVLGAQRRSGPR